jgi:WD40 repeat protein
MTPGRKYCVIFTGTTFGAFDAASGDFRGLMAPPRPTLAACRSAGFSPDGTQVAAVLRRPAQSILCWNVDVGRPAYEIDAPLGLGPGLHFGARGFLVVGGVLFDVERKQPTWLYVGNGNSRNIGVSPDQRHWLVTKPAYRETSLIATEAPSDAVLAASVSPGKLSAPLLGPGDRLAVRLDVQGFSGERKEFDAELARALGVVLDSRGLRLDKDAALTMDLKLSQHRTGESISFNSTGIGGGEAVPAHEIDFTISIAGGDGKSLWSTTGRVPPSYFLAKEEGKTLEAVLLEHLWHAAPGAIASKIDEAMPAYVRTPSTEDTLGQTRLWAGAEDISKPGGIAITSADSANASEADAIDQAPILQPIANVPVLSPVRDLLVLPAPYEWMVTAGDDGAVRLWDPRTSRKLDEVRQGRFSATRLAKHANGSAFVFGSEDGHIRTYDLARRKAGGGYDGANGAITALAVTLEQAVIAGTQGGRVFRWFEDTRSNPTVIADGKAAVSGLAAVPYSNRALVAWADGAAKVVDVGTGEAAHEFDLQAGPIHAVAVSPDGQTGLLGTETGGAVVVSLTNGKELARVGEGSTTAVAFRPDGMKFVTGTRLGHAVLWGTEDQNPENRLEGAGGHISGLVFSTNGQAIAAGVVGRRVVPVWDLSASGEAGPSGSHDAPAGMDRGPLQRPRRPLGPAAAHSP